MPLLLLLLLLPPNVATPSAGQRCNACLYSHQGLINSSAMRWVLEDRRTGDCGLVILPCLRILFVFATILSSRSVHILASARASPLSSFLHNVLLGVLDRCASSRWSRTPVCLGSTSKLRSYKVAVAMAVYLVVVCCLSVKSTV
jgi:hypothetical protein